MMPEETSESLTVVPSLGLPSPPVPPINGTFILLFPAEWRWFVSTAQWQNTALQTQLALTTQNQKTLENIMATIADLTAAVKTLKDNDAALATEVAALEASVNALILAFENLKNSGGLSAADQAALDAAVADVTAAASDLAAQTASLLTEQGAVPPTT